MDGEGSWNLPELMEEDKPLERTVLNTKSTNVQDACRRVNFVASSSMLKVFDFTLWRVSAPTDDNVSANDALRRTAEASKLQIRHDRLAAQLSSIASEGGTWHSMAR